MSNMLTRMARELLEIEEDFPFRLDYTKPLKPNIDDFCIHTFEQTWASTALGFGGIGGQAFTNARTYVFIPEIPDQKCHVYFAGRYAYASDYNDAFIEDVKRGQMVSVAMKGKYISK